MSTNTRVKIQCAKLEPKENIAAFMENRELIRDSELVQCPKRLIKKLMSNYIIIKKIISNLSWQDQIICKHVCSTWCSAVSTLQKEQFSPQDFVFSQYDRNVTYRKSGNFNSEPLAVITFSNNPALCYKCNDISSDLCLENCGENHLVYDFIQQEICYPKECTFNIISEDLFYSPLNSSTKAENKIEEQSQLLSFSLLTGIFIPIIPNVQFEVINLTSNDIKEDFFAEVNRISKDKIIKGVLIFLTDKYPIHCNGDIAFLNYLNTVQPDIPFALGGCIIQDTICNQCDTSILINNINKNQDFCSGNVISLCTFTVPKMLDCNKVDEKSCNFNMHSLIIDSSNWDYNKIQKLIDEFSQKVLPYEHSVAFKFTCTGREELHNMEKDAFRNAFPNTRLIGCYTKYGELGLDHPIQNVENFKNISPRYISVYSYCTVFVYIGWGKYVPLK